MAHALHNSMVAISSGLPELLTTETVATPLV